VRISLLICCFSYVSTDRTRKVPISLFLLTAQHGVTGSMTKTSESPIFFCIRARRIRFQAGILTTKYIQGLTRDRHSGLSSISSHRRRSADIYYGAFRDSAQKIYGLFLSGDKLLFDYQANVGDAVPAYGGTTTVTGIDSIAIGGVYHKRWSTSITGFTL
jgi:hypothetical protein